MWQLSLFVFGYTWFGKQECAKLRGRNRMTKTLSTPQLDNAADNKLRSTQPKLFKVFMHNDDYTTMDFVIEVLQAVFHKESVEATVLMLQIHRSGQALCGLYPFEIAETKVVKVHKQAREAGFPLLCTLESV